MRNQNIISNPKTLAKYERARLEEEKLDQLEKKVCGDHFKIVYHGGSRGSYSIKRVCDSREGFGVSFEYRESAINYVAEKNSSNHPLWPYSAYPKSHFLNKVLKNIIS